MMERTIVQPDLVVFDIGRVAARRQYAQQRSFVAGVELARGAIAFGARDREQRLACGVGTGRLDGSREQAGKQRVVARRELDAHLAGGARVQLRGPACARPAASAPARVRGSQQPGFGEVVEVVRGERAADPGRRRDLVLADRVATREHRPVTAPAHGIGEPGQGIQAVRLGYFSGSHAQSLLQHDLTLEARSITHVGCRYCFDLGVSMRKLSVRPAITLKGRKFKGMRGYAGKPFHPPLTDIPIGAYVIAAVLDVISVIGGSKHAWAHDTWHAATYVFIGGAIVSVFTALTGLFDWMRSSEPGTQALRTANTHALIMVTVTVLVLVDIALRLNSYHTDFHTPVGIMILSVVIAALVSWGATYGGSLVFDYGFNVETAGDSPVWHASETDVFPGDHG